VRRPPTDHWDQLRLLVSAPDQETCELLRPIVLFGQSPTGRAREDRRRRADAAAQGGALRRRRDA
jgi:hypothetical protein